jgi:Tfp pilus assembly major pilin PilA
MFKNSPRVISLVKIFVELCAETLIYIIIAGVIVILEAINLYEEYFMKNDIVQQQKRPTKVNVILLCTHTFSIRKKLFISCKKINKPVKKTKVQKFPIQYKRSKFNTRSEPTIRSSPTMTTRPIRLTMHANHPRRTYAYNKHYIPNFFV